MYIKLLRLFLQVDSPICWILLSYELLEKYSAKLPVNGFIASQPKLSANIGNKLFGTDSFVLYFLL